MVKKKMFYLKKIVMSAYDKERVNKISQIMPQFSKVAQVGDTVLMGLEGDPLFPASFKTNRPSATITNIVERENDYMISLKNKKDGSVQKVSSLSIAGDQVWEFDDKSFKNVLERQKATHEARAEPSIPEYRGAEDVKQLKSEIALLRNELKAERENTRNFHNTMIASMNEMAGDICKLDTSGKHTEFCRVLNKEYSNLMASRAEAAIEYTSPAKSRAGSHASSRVSSRAESPVPSRSVSRSASRPASPASYRGVEEDFSADDTDFF